MGKQLLQTKFFIGIEHSSTKEKISYNALILKKTKTELNIELCETYNNFEDLTAVLDKQFPIFLIVNNQNVLTKKIKNVFEEKEAVAEAFPNLKIDAFYYEVLKTSDTCFVSICRKDVVENILKGYAGKQLNIIGFSLGNLVASQITTLVNLSNIKTSNSTLTIADKKITDIVLSSDDTPTSYTINGLTVTHNTILPLAGIISYYTNNRTTSSNFLETTTALKQNFKQKRFFNIAFKTSLATLFALLLVSFLFFSYFSQKINTLNAELELNKTYKKTLVKLSDAVKKKERLVNDYSTASSKVSWYLDKIGSGIPASILLSDVQFQPLLKSIQEDKSVLFNENTIFVKGKSKKSTDFTKWIHALEQQNWAKEVKIQEYGTHKKVSPEFNILITIGK